MPPDYVPHDFAPFPLIPDPSTIRLRLCAMRTETRFLARLLRLAEDRLLSLPTTQKVRAATSCKMGGSGA